MTGRQTRSRTRITTTTAELVSVARDDQLPPLPYVTQTQFNSLETKIESLMTFLHNQTPKAAEPAPNSSENHNGPPHLVEHQNTPPGVQPTGMGQGFSPSDAIPQMGPAVTPPVTIVTCYINPAEKHRPHPEEDRLPDHLSHPAQWPTPAQRLAPNLVVEPRNGQNPGG
ncbi:Uncharacterized protein Fot_20614 [Forsythia ovata]|uniref:Uncharacterized protein n=1 Tax=Forsythia ovata TaxID=205694 RepID=A0ABD1USH9_9LAMI